MALAHWVLWLARQGNAPEEYEDAFAADPDGGRFAVADGASESGFAKCWAELLVRGFVEQAELPLEQWAERLPALQRQWESQVAAQALPWYAQAKFQQGAFATFLGLVVGPSADGGMDWHAVAVGDTCLFHCRADKLLKAFPLAESGRFNNYPNLVGSRAAPEHVRDKLSLYCNGRAESGDWLWLMTDALAAYALAREEQKEPLWQELEELVGGAEYETLADERFASWVAHLRHARRLRNDDVTLLAIKC